MPISLTTVPVVDPDTRADVIALAAAVTAEDGSPPLNDESLIQLDSPDVHHIVAREDGHVAGYAQRNGDTAEILTRAPHADALLRAVEQAAPGPLTVWAHGEGSALIPALRRRGYRRERTLHQLRRPMAEPIPEAPLPEGVTVRAFAVGVDEADWLRVNAAAFSDHPEQGGWTRADLAAREAEAWFDADGFLLAHRGEHLLGFHWTKIHPDGMGEVYVIGVDPAATGLRLGPALLSRGLMHLRERGCTQVELYVDESNATAMRLYERYGFQRHDVDVQWRAPTAEA